MVFWKTPAFIIADNISYFAAHQFTSVYVRFLYICCNGGKFLVTILVNLMHEVSKRFTDGIINLRGRVTAGSVHNNGRSADLNFDKISHVLNYSWHELWLLFIKN